MSIATGNRFGSYEIGEVIGAGGMGEVYRATDTKLKRDAAIKVLPASVATDPDRLARFRREAEVLAALAALELTLAVGGGSVNDIDSNNETPLHGVMYRGAAIALIDFLVERGASLEGVVNRSLTSVAGR